MKNAFSFTPFPAFFISSVYSLSSLFFPLLTLSSSAEPPSLLQLELFEKTTLQYREQLLNQTPIFPHLKDPWIDTPPPAQLQSPLQVYPWHQNITTTTFWVGETATQNNPVPNTKSSWDSRWQSNFGGFDNPNPKERIFFRPAYFLPKQNPFYIALPYNDVINSSTTKPEASQVIPWFATAFTKPGQTVLKGRWIAIHYKGRVCYAQWEDCGPYRTDHWQYVFSNQRPSPNPNQNAGLDVSPAVRDYLGMQPTDTTDWKFVEIHEVPHGPWSKWGENNPLSPSFKSPSTASITQ